MASKIISYVLCAVGVFILALGVKPVNESVVNYIPFIKDIPQMILLTIGVIIVAVGIFLLRFSSPAQQKEVPIYQGKKVVGYRRMK